jgi:hypothetical protein
LFISPQTSHGSLSHSACSRNDLVFVIKETVIYTIESQISGALERHGLRHPPEWLGTTQMPVAEVRSRIFQGHIFESVSADPEYGTQRPEDLECSTVIL